MNGWVIPMVFLLLFEAAADIFSKQYALTGSRMMWFSAIGGFVVANAFWLAAIRRGSGLARGGIVFSVGSAILAVLLGLLLYKENTNKLQLTGMILGVLSIIIIFHQKHNMDDQDLTKKHCVPCEGGTLPIPPDYVKKYLERVPGWSSPDNLKIAREFTFKDFKGSMAFINKVADVAEAEGHHPDIYIFWNKVKLDLSTHAIGGLSENDFILAAKVNAI